jgi:RimJ/RimL family protein N-acetyltransferase
MKTGKVIRSLSMRDGREAVLRTPRWEDLDDLLDMINSLVEEKADIARGEKLTREEEAGWLSSVLRRVETGEEFYLVAEVDGKVVANSEISLGTGSFDTHVGGIGIAIKEGYRDMGLGTEMMRTLIEQAKTIGLDVLTLCAFATNEKAIHVYEKVGFMKTGAIPRKFLRNGKYVDEVMMTLLLE